MNLVQNRTGRSGRGPCIRILALGWAVCALATTAAALPPHDECASPAPIAGEGGWNVDDLVTATQSTTPPPIPGTLRDVWFCWTPTWTGLAQLDLHTGGQLSATVHNGCACPAAGTAPVLMLSPVNTVGTFQVTCGQQFLIRIAAESFPFPPNDPVRDFTLSKVSGDDCPPPPPGGCDECCGGKPRYDDPLYSSNFTGQVAVVTQSVLGIFGNGGGPIVTIFNLGATPQPIPGGVWDPIPGPAPTAFRYTKPNWDAATLGSVFPLTLDASGNIYTAYCAATNAPKGSSIPGSTSGTIFRIPNGTGVPQVFCNIPDNAAPPVGCNGALVLCGTPSTCPPGIGDVCCDCSHGGQFFASAFADGRIYRISAAGTPLECFDHATNAIQPPTREPGNSYDRYVPREERVWAVKAHQGRLYYSVWGQEFACVATTLSPGSTPNRIWSVGLTTTGAFVPNSRRMELQVPIYPRTPRPQFGDIVDFKASSPVSDISFSADCKMMLAERAVSENGVTVGAHVTRGLEFAPSGTAWIPSFPRNGYGYPIGQAPVGLPNTNACGGCDYDTSTGGTANGRVWFTGDTLSPYGITGLDPTAPALATAVHIDGNDSSAGGKATECDVEIPCAVECATINDTRILCEIVGTPPMPSGNFTYTFTFTNNVSPPQPIQFIFFSPGCAITPLSIALATPVAPGATSPPITVTISGHMPGETVCCNITFANPEIESCCRIEHCVVLPRCDCLQLPECRVECDPATGNYSITFTVQNLGMGAINELHIFPLPIGGGVTATPADFFFPSVPPFGTAGPFTTVITGAGPGQLCLRISVHLDGMECCSEVKCVTLPQCDHIALCPADVNHDGVVSSQDLFDFLAAFFGNCTGTPPPPGPPCNGVSGDFNNSGAISSQDIFDFLAAYFSPCD